MDIKRVSNKQILFAQFKEQELERQFYNNEITDALKYLKPIIIILGLLYLLFIIPDYFLIKDSKTFNFIFLNRLLIFLLVLILYIKLIRLKDYCILVYWFTALEIIASLSFLYIFLNYDSPDFLIQAFGVIIIILGIFLIPNRWIFSLVASIFISIGFFCLSLYYLSETKISQFSAGFVYIFLAIFMMSISSYRVNYYKRVQYINTIRLIKQSTTDQLTGIYNRIKFNDEFDKWMKIFQRYDNPLVFVLFDIDDFKKINDTYGHLVGDIILVEITQLVSQKIRDTDILARWGGEEFVLLLPNIQILQAVDLMERLRIAICEYDFAQVAKISCSFGVVSLNKNDSLDTVIQRADNLLYKAKNVSNKNAIMIEE